MSPSYAANSAQGTLWPAVLRHFFFTETHSELDQTGTGYHHTSDILSMFDAQDYGHPGNAGLSGSLSDMFSDLTRPPEANMVYPPHNFNPHVNLIPPPSVNHVSNPPIPPHTIAPQHQGGTGVHLPTSGLSQNKFGTFPLFHSTSYTTPVSLEDAMQQSQSSNTAINGQSHFSAAGPWVVGGG